MTGQPDYRLEATDDTVRSYWDRSADPVLSVTAGESVEFECRDAHNGQITEDTTAADIQELDADPIHPLTGPVEIEGASPNDVLEVEILACEHHGYGYSLFYAEDKGLIPEEFEEDGFYYWELDRDIGHFVDGIEVPLDPFPGVIGIAPAAEGRHSTIPPRSSGGNLDIKHLTAGATLYLPIETDGALFSVGDCHAAQGDGEVCVTGIEAPMDITIRFDVRPDMTIAQPRFETSRPFTPTGVDESMVGTTGIADDLKEASKRAIRQMIDHLQTFHRLSKEQAYILCSAVVDLKINELVNEPNYVVSAYLPESIFPEVENR